MLGQNTTFWEKVGPKYNLESIINLCINLVQIYK